VKKTFILEFYCTQIYVEYSVKNPLYTLGEPIESELFATKLDELVRTATFYR
jgi:hypothetical protein